MIPVRGLAATRDIAEGEVVIRIPLQALFSVSTTIDHDPVLSRVMGPDARRLHGWNMIDQVNNQDVEEGEDTTEAFYMVEIPLLAVALLHHKRLGSTSPLQPYLRILETTPVDSMPFLWPASKLKHDLSEGIRTVARGVKREMKIMYETVVVSLIEKHPELFGPPAPNGSARSVDPVTEWMFSFEKFQWAFAIVNSRHWQLPISDLQQQKQQVPPRAAPPRTQRQQHNHPDADEQLLPPADMPTESWVQEQKDVEAEDNDQYENEETTSGRNREEGMNANNSRDRIDARKASQQQRQLQHSSFLAPVADLLNFGPPCTRGSYNAETHSFEIVASCSFRAGQEVTFWYSDECDHIMVGVYGFTHPMVPPCPSAEEYRRTSEEWRLRAESLEKQLSQTQNDLDAVDAELEYLEAVVSQCDCDCGTNKKGNGNNNHHHHNSNGRLRHEHVRGSLFREDDIERRGVRKMRRERNSEF